MQKGERIDHSGNHKSVLNGHKMTDCLKFVEMQKIFHGKYVAVAKVQPIVETQTITTNVNVVDVNVITRSKVIEEHVFKDREPREAKSVVDWEKEKRLKKSMVETIQQIQKIET
jgi:phosphopantothenate synthetase